MQALNRDCWITLNGGVVFIERGKHHCDYFSPTGTKASKEHGLDRGFIRVSTLGTTNGGTLHFEFKAICPRTSRLILDAIEHSNAELINLEFHSPKYTLRSSLSPQEVILFLKQAHAETAGDGS
jgi:hypothetical protein